MSLSGTSHVFSWFLLVKEIYHKPRGSDVGQKTTDGIWKDEKGQENQF